jgi:crotonobetaine/carnitine-CoA ligase
MPTQDKRLPSAEECVIRNILHKHARDQPDAPFAIFADGSQWTYSELLATVRRTAAGLQSLGVKQGDHVFCWLPNGADCLRVWFAINYLGAIYVPANLAYKGSLLEHVINLSDARIGVVHADLAPRLNDVALHVLTDVVIVDGDAPTDERLNFYPMAVLDAAFEPSDPPAPIEPWDMAYIIFTSGTTGPSKGVMSSYTQVWTQNVEALALVGASDRFMMTLPMFHVGGTGPIYCMLANGASVAVVDSFSTEKFWQTVDQTQSTYCILLGVMTPFLLSQPPSDQDKQHSLRIGLMVPWAEDAATFSQRFGVELFTVFNMTEVSTPIVSGINPPEVGVAGTLRSGFDARIVDDNDCELATGQVGELIVRSDRPWSMNSGYYKNPEATAKAWRNGWFHTGDAFRVDAAGNYFFVDRIKDAIRRRGENISSFEVEAEVQMHDSIQEAAAIAVKSDLSEDEVMVCVSLAPDRSLDPAELISFLEPRMAHFMIPRYVRIMDELPKTPTSKVQKHLLKDEAVTVDTWDRERAGIKIKRERIGKR